MEDIYVGLVMVRVTSGFILLPIIAWELIE